MNVVAIHSEPQEASSPLFRAIAGKQESVGRTAGEALDALLAQEAGNIESTAILIQRFGPDIYFTQAQHDRMKTLLGQRNILTPEESDELDALIDAELAATVARTEALTRHLPS